MFGFSIQNKPELGKIEKAADTATFKNLRRAAFAISKTAKQSIIRSREPGDPGSPPNTRGRGRKNIRGAIFYDADKESAIIGPRESYVGDSAKAHEFGEQYKGTDYDERPFMLPAMQANAPRFAEDWRGTIGE